MEVGCEWGCTSNVGFILAMRTVVLEVSKKRCWSVDSPVYAFSRSHTLPVVLGKLRVFAKVWVRGTPTLTLTPVSCRFLGVFV
jgi:hypothetical protein